VTVVEAQHLIGGDGERKFIEQAELTLPAFTNEHAADRAAKETKEPSPGQAASR
jgi:hypothetical protein